MRINEKGDSQKQGNGSDGFRHGVVSPQYGNDELLRNHSDARVMGIRLPRNYTGDPSALFLAGGKRSSTSLSGIIFLRFGVASYG